MERAEKEDLSIASVSSCKKRPKDRCPAFVLFVSFVVK
jgi:hypothetical protein